MRRSVDDAISHPVCPLTRGFTWTEIRQDHGELIAAQARDVIGIAHHGLQDLSHFDQGRITDSMPMQVVNWFKPIKIDVAKRHFVRAPRRRTHRLGRLFIE